jgi:hypothetical protein
MAANRDSPNGSNQADPQNDPRLDLNGQFQWSLNGISLSRLAPILFALVLGGGSVGIGTFLQDKSPSILNEPEIEQPASDRLPSDLTAQRYTCSEIGDRETAQRLFAEGHTYLDKDGDGIACESLK